MISAAGKDRDKAFISLGHELGLRVSENLLLRVGDIQFDDFGALVHVRRGKTGSRIVRASLLANEPLSWVGADRMVKEAGRKAGIKKERMHMHMFRHGSATRNAKSLTDSELKLMYGWIMDSRMPLVYIHLSGGDLDHKYQQGTKGHPACDSARIAPPPWISRRGLGRLWRKLRPDRRNRSSGNSSRKV